MTLTYWRLSKKHLYGILKSYLTWNKKYTSVKNVQTSSEATSSDECGSKINDLLDLYFTTMGHQVLQLGTATRTEGCDFEILNVFFFGDTETYKW